ncbi:tetratricopeptide repeat protein, partial [Acinetobacter baumannii]
METFAEPVFSNDLLAKAENGDTSAQLELAEIYLYGHGVDSDENQAEVWALKSAENGNVAAMFWLADGYVTYARLMEDDDKNDSLEHFQKAFKWFQKASENGHSESMVELADLYTRADSGIEVNINKAFELREKAAKLGNKKAMRSLSV